MQRTQKPSKVHPVAYNKKQSGHSMEIKESIDTIIKQKKKKIKSPPLHYLYSIFELYVILENKRYSSVE